MKNLNEYLVNEAVYDKGLEKAIDILVNILNNHTDDIDSVVWDILDKLTNNGEDDIVVKEVEAWLNNKK